MERLASKLIGLRYFNVNDIVEDIWAFESRCAIFGDTPNLEEIRHLYHVALKIKESFGIYLNKLYNDVGMSILDNDIRQQIKTNIWLGDSGASNHMGWDERGMYDIKEVNLPIKIGSGTIMATKIGKKRLTVVQKDGSNMDLILEDFILVPDLWVNLFSIMRAIKEGWNIGNKGIKFILKKERKRSHLIMNLK